MLRHSSSEYLQVMDATNGEPLLHTVLFEPASDTMRSIQGSDSLVDAVRSMKSIKGVQNIRVASRSILSPHILEEIAISDNDALQNLRIDTAHDAVVDLARKHTNWKVVDRLLPREYWDEFEVIRSASERHKPVTRQTIVSFKDGTADEDISDVMGLFREITGNSERLGLLFPAEVSQSLDRRKGTLGIVRETWDSLDSATRAGLSKEYLDLSYDLGDIATKTTVLNYIEAEPDTTF